MLLADATSGGFIALWTVIYVVPLVTLGFCSIRKDRWIMFIFGLFIALFGSSARFCQTALTADSHAVTFVEAHTQ